MLVLKVTDATLLRVVALHCPAEFHRTRVLGQIARGHMCARAFRGG